LALTAQAVNSVSLDTGSSSLITFFRQTGPAAKAVLAILLFFSLMSWLIIIAKYIRLHRVRGQSLRFLDFFRKSKRFSEVNSITVQLTDTPLTTLFKSGYAELDAQIKAARSEDQTTAIGIAGGASRLLIKNISGIERALERAAGAEVSRMTKYLTFLATTAAACPFIGLFGTVWGIMSAFNAIGMSGSTSIVAVAPGISEALINTAAGLAAAIPALVAYNYFMGQIRQMRATMDDFALEFLNLAERHFT
jgi:biopolymer transport protein TolQ